MSTFIEKQRKRIRGNLLQSECYRIKIKPKNRPTLILRISQGFTVLHLDISFVQSWFHSFYLTIFTTDMNSVSIYVFYSSSSLVAKVLIANGADENEVNSEGSTALVLPEGHSRIVEVRR